MLTYNMEVDFVYLPIFVTFTWVVRIPGAVSEPLAETRLHAHLLLEGKYNNLIRPAGNNGSGQLTVELGMRLSQLLNVDQKNQIMTTNIWLRHEWNDFRLKWDPEAFEGIRMTHMRAEDLWIPDIVLYNNADGDFVITLLTKAAVHFDGHVVWEPPAIYKSYCPINVEFFPFDQQECFMKFGCWTHNGQAVDLQHLCAGLGTFDSDGVMTIQRGIDIKEYYQNVEWDIINVTAKRQEKFYPCCPGDPYPYITFYLTLRRRTLFYTINLIMPCISISALTVLVFYLPSDSGEKITLSISILLALTVFFLLLSDINPPTSIVIPLIGKYLLFTMLVVTASIFLTVYTLNVNLRSPATHTMSPWVKKVFTEILPRILLMKRPDVAKRDKREREAEIRESRDSLDGCIDTPDTGNCTSSPTYENIRQRHTSDVCNSGISEYSEHIQEAVKSVKFIAKHMKEGDMDKKASSDWTYVAMVMDRLFLFIFTTACVSGTMGIFLHAPSLYDPREHIELYDPTFNCSF